MKKVQQIVESLGRKVKENRVNKARTDMTGIQLILKKVQQIVAAERRKFKKIEPKKESEDRQESKQSYHVKNLLLIKTESQRK